MTMKRFKIQIVLTDGYAEPNPLILCAESREEVIKKIPVIKNEKTEVRIIEVEVK